MRKTFEYIYMLKKSVYNAVHCKYIYEYKYIKGWFYADSDFSKQYSLSGRSKRFPMEKEGPMDLCFSYSYLFGAGFSSKMPQFSKINCMKNTFLCCCNLASVAWYNCRLLILI